MCDTVTQRLCLTIHNELAEGIIVVRNIVCFRYNDLSKLFATISWDTHRSGIVAAKCFKKAIHRSSYLWKMLKEKQFHMVKVKWCHFVEVQRLG